MKTKNIMSKIAALTMTALPLSLSAAEWYWDADPLAAGIQNGAGTWDASLTNWQTGADNNAAWGNGGADHAIFGGGAGTTGTITVSGQVKGNNLTINSGGYVFTGGDIAFESNDANTSILNLNAAGGTTTFNNQLSVRRILFSQANQTLNLNGTRNLGFLYTWGQVTASIIGSDAAIARSSLVRMTGGFYNSCETTLNIGDTVSETGGLSVETSATYNIGRNNSYIGSGGEGLVTVNGGWFRIAPDGSGGLNIGNLQASSTGKMIVNSGSLTVNNNGRINIAQMGKGELSVRGGVVDAGTVYDLVVTQGAAATGILTVSGGTLYARGLQFGSVANTTGSATLTQTGGAIYLGVDGMKLGDAVTGLTPSITLSGGIVGATAAWSSTLRMTLANGVTTFKAANVSGAANDITLGGELSGAGQLVKTGGGTLLLNAANSYGGGTIVSGGVLQTGEFGTLGAGDVFVDASAALILGGSGAIDEAASLSFASGASITLDFTDTLTLSGLFSGGDVLAAGTYSVAKLNETFAGTFFGNGSIIVIPEPSTLTLLFIGAGLLTVSAARRRKCER